VKFNIYNELLSDVTIFWRTLSSYDKRFLSG